MLLLIDNYDSFVYNLARYVEELGIETRVVRNDALDVTGIQSLAPQAIIISPGPCTPHEAGVSVEAIRALSPSIPMLGVCLGHQAIATAFDAAVVRAREPVHGRTSIIEHSQSGLFSGIPSPLRVARYHSLMIDESTLPADIFVTARSEDGTPMAVMHRSRPLYGVQFHPESVLTQYGHRLLANFARIASLPTREVTATDWSETEPEEAPQQPVVSW